MPHKYGNIVLSGLTFCLLALAACQTSSQGPHSYAHGTKMIKASSAENLLKAEGGMFRMVEMEAEDDAEISPLEAHMRARKNVHPAQTKTASKYTKRYDPDGQEIHMRTLRLEPIDSMQSDTPEPTQYARADITVIPRTKPEFSGPKKTKTIKASSSKKAAVVENVRFGEHPGSKTRMVLDLTARASFSHKLSDENKLLIIQIPGADWDAGLETKILQHPLIVGYRAQSDKNGMRLSLKLKKPARVIWSTTLKADKGKGDRIIFDIAAL